MVDRLSNKVWNIHYQASCRGEGRSIIWAEQRVGDKHPESFRIKLSATFLSGVCPRPLFGNKVATQQALFLMSMKISEAEGRDGCWMLLDSGKAHDLSSSSRGPSPRITLRLIRNGSSILRLRHDLPSSPDLYTVTWARYQSIIQIIVCLTFPLIHSCSLLNLTPMVNMAIYQSGW